MTSAAAAPQSEVEHRVMAALDEFAEAETVEARDRADRLLDAAYAEEIRERRERSERDRFGFDGEFA